MIRSVAFSAVLLFGIVLAAAAQTPFARHAFAVSQIPCYDRLLRRASTDADLMFLGSSRILMGIDVAEFSSYGAPSRSFNLAHNDRSYITDRLLFDEVTRTHRPEIAIVEAYVPSRRSFALERSDGFQRAGSGIVDGGDYDRLAVAFGRYGDLAIAAARWPLGWRNDLMVAAAKVDQFAGETLSGRLARAYIAGRSRFDTSDDQVCRPLRRGAPARNVDIRKRYIARFNPVRPDDWMAWAPDRPEFLTDVESGSARRELRALAALARARGVKLAFLYLPSKFIPPPDDHFDEAFADRIGAPLLVPPRAVLRALQDGGFADEAHLNVVGRRLVSRWLAEELSGRRHAA